MHGIRSLVSKKKRRFQDSSFDLDLSYVTEKIIAMGFPAEKLEGMYRNHRDEVIRFLEERHKDHYKLYNLCSERHYDTSKFHNRVVRFPFDDHNAPPFSLISEFCQDMDAFLGENPENVAVVHCKAGKGRTGVMISCYLLYCQMWPTATEALKFFAVSRTEDLKGVTIPSQNRYVHYFDRFLKEGEKKIPIFELKAIRFHTIPNYGSGGGCDPRLRIYVGKQPVFQSKTYQVKNEGYDIMEFPIDGISVSGDVKIEFHHKETFSAVEMFHFWFHTAFVDPENAFFKRTELDKAHKEKRKKYFDPNFKLELVLVPKGFEDEHSHPRLVYPRFSTLEHRPAQRSSTVEEQRVAMPIAHLGEAMTELKLTEPLSIQEAIRISQTENVESSDSKLESKSFDSALSKLEATFEILKESVQQSSSSDIEQIQKELENIKIADESQSLSPKEEVQTKIGDILQKARTNRSVTLLKGASGILAHVAVHFQIFDPLLSSQIKNVDATLTDYSSDDLKLEKLRTSATQQKDQIISAVAPPSADGLSASDKLALVRLWCNVLSKYTEKLRTVTAGLHVRNLLKFDVFKVPPKVEQEDDDDDDDEDEEDEAENEEQEALVELEKFTHVGKQVHNQLSQNLEVLSNELSKQEATLEQAKIITSIFMVLNAPS